MAEDWTAVGTAITTRMEEMKLSQAALAAKAQVSVALVRQLQHNYQPRRRNPLLLESISRALDWPANRLAEIASGQPTRQAEDPLDALRAEVASLRAGLEALEQRFDKLTETEAGR